MFRSYYLRAKLLSLSIIPLVALLIVSGYEYNQVKTAADEVEHLAHIHPPFNEKYQHGAELSHEWEDALAHVETIEYDTLINGLSLSFLTIIIALLVNTFITRWIIMQINNAACVADKISQGRRDISMKNSSQDEIGKLLLSLFKMQENIRCSEDALKKNEKQLRLIADGITGLICYIDNNEVYQFCNIHYATRYNNTPSQIIGKRVIDIVGEEKYYQIKEHIDSALQGGRRTFESQDTNNGQHTYYLANFIPHIDDKRCIQGYFVISYDITRQKLNEISLKKKTLELEHLSNTDALTGVHNRRFFSERIEDEIKRTKRYDKKLSLLMLDLDHFKNINDQYGHNTGDKVLTIVSKILKHSLRSIDVVTRYGGEEFSIMLPETDIQSATVVAEKLRHIIEEAHIPIDSKTRIDFTCSIGVAQYSPNIRNSETFIAIADEALYRAKREGRNRVITATSLVPEFELS